MTLEEYTLARDTIQNLESLRRNMRRNAQGYQADLTSGRVPFDQLVVVMGQDAQQYLRRLAWQDTLAADGVKRTKLATGLTAMGLVPAEIVDVIVELKAAANTLSSAPKGTPADARDAADALLASVAEHAMVWD